MRTDAGCGCSGTRTGQVEPIRSPGSQGRCAGGAGAPTAAASLRFTDAPQQRFSQDFETGFIDLTFGQAERGALMDLLRHERAVTLDGEALSLAFRR